MDAKNQVEQYVGEDWHEELKRVLGQMSQAQVARRLGYDSGSIVSQVVHGKYRGDVAKFREAFLGQFMGQKVYCPAVGMEIWRDQCQGFQEQTVGMSWTHVYRECQRVRCEHRRVDVIKRS